MAAGIATGRDGPRIIYNGMRKAASYESLKDKQVARSCLYFHEMKYLLHCPATGLARPILAIWRYFTSCF